MARRPSLWWTRVIRYISEFLVALSPAYSIRVFVCALRQVITCRTPWQCRSLSSVYLNGSWELIDYLALGLMVCSLNQHCNLRRQIAGICVLWGLIRQFSSDKVQAHTIEALCIIFLGGRLLCKLPYVKCSIRL